MLQLATAVPSIARIGANLLSKGGTLSKIGGFLKSIFWGSKLAAAGSGALAMSALSGGDSAAANSDASAQLQNYRA